MIQTERPFYIISDVRAEVHLISFYIKYTHYYYNLI